MNNVHLGLARKIRFNRDSDNLTPLRQSEIRKFVIVKSRVCNSTPGKRRNKRKFDRYYDQKRRKSEKGRGPLTRGRYFKTFKRERELLTVLTDRNFVFPSDRNILRRLYFRIVRFLKDHLLYPPDRCRVLMLESLVYNLIIMKNIRKYGHKEQKLRYPIRINR